MHVRMKNLIWQYQDRLLGNAPCFDCQDKGQCLACSTPSNIEAVVLPGHDLLVDIVLHGGAKGGCRILQEQSDVGYSIRVI